MAMRRSSAGFLVGLVVGALCLALAPAAQAAGHVAASSFNPANFTNPTSITNPYFPLAPGKQYVYKGQADRGNGLKPHTLIITVTGLTKVLDGVKTRVVWEQDINDGQLVESELAFFAQDKFGTVWILGEYPEEYENGVFVGAPNAWIAGVDGATPGIAMQATPTTGLPPYSQGFAPDVIDDFGQVISTTTATCLALPVAGLPGNPRCFSNVVVVRETNTSEPGDFQDKYHAPGVGVILILPGGAAPGERLELVQVNTLSAAALSDANYQAYRLDRRAYAFSEAFRNTSPAQPG
jgi:hypothetical protein